MIAVIGGTIFYELAIDYIKKDRSWKTLSYTDRFFFHSTLKSKLELIWIAYLKTFLYLYSFVFSDCFLIQSVELCNSARYESPNYHIALTNIKVFHSVTYIGNSSEISRNVKCSIKFFFSKLWFKLMHHFSLYGEWIEGEKLQMKWMMIYFYRNKNVFCNKSGQVYFTSFSLFFCKNFKIYEWIECIDFNWHKINVNFTFFHSRLILKLKNFSYFLGIRNFLITASTKKW